MKNYLFLFLFIASASFAQTGKQGTIKVEKVKAKDTISSETRIDYVVAEKVSAKNTNTYISPEYPGGEFELKKFISNNIVYPKKLVDGTCYVTFVVEKDGSISQINVAQGIKNCPECSTEAIRLIKSMPKWNPGMQNDKTVAAGVTLPIKFFNK